MRLSGNQLLQRKTIVDDSLPPFHLLLESCETADPRTSCAARIAPAAAAELAWAAAVRSKNMVNKIGTYLIYACIAEVKGDPEGILDCEEAEQDRWQLVVAPW